MLTRNLPAGPAVMLADLVNCTVPPSRSATLRLIAQPVTSAGGASWKSRVTSSPRKKLRWLETLPRAANRFMSGHHLGDGAEVAGGGRPLDRLQADADHRD